MKGSITTTITLQYVLIFTLLFAAFLALAINYNKVYKMKNETISIIEKYEGINSNHKTLEIVNNFLKSNGYNILSYCDTNEYGIKDLNNPVLEEVDANEKYYYCLSSEKTQGKSGDKVYYNVKLFFRFNLPFIGDLFTFRITGETKGIKYYNDSQDLENYRG